MNPQPDEDLQRRLQNLEAEINSSPREVSQPEKQKQPFEFSFESFNSQLTKLQSWFNTLSGTKKIVFLGVTAVVGIVMLQTVLKLVASVISLAVLAVLVYVGYKFFVSNNSQQKK
ncbi:hypothetical protein H6G04_22465 [Calothrix membranacea FACHB-236]|nr:hypothetical protein [Calothrix membranacea FACHB-236]